MAAAVRPVARVGWGGAQLGQMERGEKTGGERKKEREKSKREVERVGEDGGVLCGLAVQGGIRRNVQSRVCESVWAGCVVNGKKRLLRFGLRLHLSPLFVFSFPFSFSFSSLSTAPPPPPRRPAAEGAAEQEEEKREL